MSAIDKPWMDTSKTREQRTALLVEAMTIEEKIAQMVQISYSLVTEAEADQWALRGAGSFLHTLGNNARRLQRLACQTRLGIPVIFGIDAIHGHAIHNGATVFPSQLALAAGWNLKLAEKMAEVTAKEVAAEGLHWTFSPVFCLGRDSRWGRIDETFGEDPLLAGRMGAAFVRGYQGDDPAHPERIIACAKHYIAYGESTGGRDSYDTSVSMRTVRDIFLPPFKEAIQAGCHTVMAGYESVDRVPCSASKKLLTDVLKKELGFEGFVVTDWSNLTSLIKRQHLADNFRDASKIAIEAGNDMIMTSPEFYDAALSLVRDGTIPLSLIDESVRRIISVKFAAGIFDTPEKVKTLSIEHDPASAQSAQVFNAPAHQVTNLECARESIVLLKNEQVNNQTVLPICGKTKVPSRAVPQALLRKVSKIAVIGPNADSVRAQYGDWTYFTHPVPHLDAVPSLRVCTMLEGIKECAEQEGISVTYDKGCDIFDPAKQTIRRACRLAAKSDIVFVAVGDTLIQTGETHDRANLALSGAQNELVEALSLICRKKSIPLVSILVNSKPLEFARVVSASDAIIETFNSGTLGGRAAAEMIFGYQVPRGRLPISFPYTTGQLPVYYNQLPGWHEGSYFDCPQEPLFAFGEGLTYTQFRYDSIHLSRDKAHAGETIDVQVTLTNVGNCDAVETVQVYVTDRVASIVTPVRSLKAFGKIALTAGQTATITLALETNSLSLVTPDEQTILESGEFDIQAGHDSRSSSLISTVLTIL